MVEYIGSLPFISTYKVIAEVAHLCAPTIAHYRNPNSMSPALV